MANPKILFQKFEVLEGGFSDRKADRGGKTNMGITLSTWRSMGYDKNRDGIIDVKDLKLITKEDVYNLFYQYYWKRWKADNIQNQSLSDFLVDWVWNSGEPGIKIPQKLLGVSPDGIVGQQTLSSLNSVNARNFFELLKKERIRFVENICKNDPSQLANLKGWKNRINSFTYQD